MYKRQLLPDTRLLIQPKIDGCAVAIKYENGKLEKAISRRGIDITQKIKTTNTMTQIVK